MAEQLGDGTLFGRERPLRALSDLFVTYFSSPYRAMNINPIEALPQPAQFRQKAADLLAALERGENPLASFCEKGTLALVEQCLLGKPRLTYLTVVLDLPHIAEKIFGADYGAQVQFAIHQSVLAEIPEVDVED